MYTLENLQQKNLKELKEIGWQLNVLPAGDRRCRQNWIDALIGTEPPLLQLLEVSTATEVESVEEAIEVQAQEPLLESPAEALECPSCGAVHALYSTEDYLDRPEIRCLHCNYSRFKNYPGAIRLEAQEPIESKFGRIVYPKPAAQPIAQTEINATISDVKPRLASADFHHSLAPTAEPDGGSSSDEAEALGSQAGDRVLALARNSEGDKGRALPHQPNELAVFNDEQPPNRGEGKGRVESELSQSAIAPAAKESLDVNCCYCNEPEYASLRDETYRCYRCEPENRTTGITFSPRFLATCSPYFGEVRYKAEATGQLNLLEPEIDNEPPEPDDFPSIDAFNEAMARWDAENPEALVASMDSMCEWAPCPEEWYEPEPESLPLKASSMREPSEVSELSLAPKSSSTCNFSIPTFDAWCDRGNRHDDTDEPPDTGIFARLPKPKPPSFPPRAMAIPSPRAIGYSEKCFNANRHTTHIAAGSSRQSGRSPPGGDFM